MGVEAWCGRCSLLAHLGVTTQPSGRGTSGERVIGVFPGTGVGPEVVRACLRVLEALAGPEGCAWRIRWGGPIGEAAQALGQGGLPEEAVQFCQQVFAEGGAILSGPGGGRYVYDLRKRLNLFCKFVPVRPWPQLSGVGRLKPQHTEGVDLLIVRDNAGGVYQGTWRSHVVAGQRVAEHTFSYTEAQVKNVATVAARAAAARRGKLMVVVKDGGIPAISDLWRQVATQTARQHDVQATIVNVDLAAYQILQHPRQLDVVVTPNLFGDILADMAGVLVGSRGLGFSGNFAPDGSAVYQTNHGCAHDLAGTGRANPVGQILALAMLLRESFGLDQEAERIEAGVAAAWRAGWRTDDLAEPGCRTVGTQEMAERIAEAVAAVSPEGMRP